MLKILQGAFTSDAHDIIKNEIRTLTEKKEKVFLIVPEQQTVSTEKEMADFLPNYAPLYFEVTNFTRFANTVFRNLGGVAGEYADSATRSLIMWRVLTELSPTLSMTRGGGEINTGTVEKALSAVKEMQSLSIGAEALSDAANKEEIAENTRLRTKLSDLSMIMSLYKKLLCEKFLDAEDDLIALSKKAKENPDFFSDAYFFIEGFTSFTSAQNRLISALSALSEVTVSLCIPKESETAFEFTELKLAKDSLRRGLSHGTKFLSSSADGKNESKNPVISEIISLMWKSEGVIENPERADGVLRMFSASDPYEECDFIAADIKRLVMAGASYSDFAIIARSAEDYAGIIDTALMRAKIPSFLGKRRDLSTFEAIKLIYTALSMIDSDFRRGDVISYAKCGLSGISPDACDEFELYTECWQINGKRFYDGLLWNMNPDGYTDRKAPDTTEKLERINRTREKIISPVIKLREEFSEAKTTLDYATALYKFLSEIELDARISERIEELYAFGETAAAEENSQIWKIISSSLDKMVKVLGDSPTDRRGFVSQLKTVISAADVGRIPSYSDEVTIGSADMVRLSGKKHIYLMGVSLGEFPLAPKDNSYFTDRDKLILASLILPLENEKSEVRHARELYAFSRAAAIASESLTITYSERKKDFSTAKPAEVITRIEEICSEKVKVKKVSTLPPCEKIYTFENAVSGIDSLSRAERESVECALSALGYADDLTLSASDIRNETHTLSEDIIPLLYRENISLTQSRLDEFVNCPFAHFLHYTLRLSESEEANFGSRNIGNFIHSVLENFFGTLERCGGSVTDLTPAQKNELIRNTARRYVDSVCEDGASRTKRMEILVDRLCRATAPIIEDMCDEMQDCKFVPKFFELPITGEDDGFPSPAQFESEGGRRVFVYGNIDRVDTYKNDKDVYVRVIDYKTGSKDFSPSDLEEGKNLQMFLYLKSIVDTQNEAFLRKIGVEEGGRLIPAGVIYVKADLSTVTLRSDDAEEAMKSAKKNQSRRGMILDNEISIAAMNKAFTPVRWKKDGEIDARTEKYLYDAEGWTDIEKKMETVINRVSSSMETGKIKAEPNPDTNPCSYCRYKVICRSEKAKKR